VGGTSKLSYDVVCRAMWLCDGCNTLLDADQAHHMPRPALFIFALMTSVYGVTFGLAFGAVGSMLGDQGLASNQLYVQAIMLMVVLCVAVAVIRRIPVLRYQKVWVQSRPKAVKPSNSRGGFDRLLKARWPNLVGYGVMSWNAEQVVEWGNAGVPIPSTDPNGKAWAGQRPTNIIGTGVNGFYRLLWTTGNIRPLTSVNGVQGLPETAYKLPSPSALQVFVGTALFSTIAAIMYLAKQPPPVGLGVSGVIAAGSFVMAKHFEDAHGRTKLPF